MKQHDQLRTIGLLLALLCAAITTPAFSQAPPTELEGSWSITDTAIELRWHAPDVTPAPTHYNVYRKAGDAPAFDLLTTAPDRRYDDDDVAGGTAYSYKVTAFYTATGESAPTNTVTVTAGGDSVPGGGGSGTLPPRELIGSFDDRGVVELDWLWPDSGHSPLSYNVYRALSADSAFSLLANVPEGEHDDSIITANTGYLYYVKALYNGAAESIPSNTVFVQTGSLDDTTGDDSSGVIAFTSQPVLSGMVGEPYQYQAVVVTTPPGLAVCYELTHAPSGMTVDAGGLVTWLPGSLGVFEVEIKARICPDGEDAEQEFHLMVLSGAAASIHGTVTDTSGSPLDSIRIKIFDVSTGDFVLKTRTDVAGQYVFPIVNPGTYFVRADADETPYEDVWYVNSHELAGATPVVVAESSDVAVNFTLSAEHGEPSENHSVSGTVRDTSGNPVAGASVSLMKLSDDYGDDDDFFDDDSHHDGHHGDDDSERHALTDSAGAFHIVAHDGDYIVRAKAQGFFEQYWDGQPSPLEAQILSLHADTAGIDFALIPKPPGLEGDGSISGTVRRADNLAPLRAEVLGFMKNSSGHFTGLIASDHTDSNGVYTLDELPAGFYLVMVKDEDGVVPTFYSTSGSTPFADSASLVAVSASAVTGIDIDAIIDSADGLNNISGEVEIEIETPGKTAFRAPLALGPLAGAIVTVVDGAGNVAGSAVTEADGMYTAHGLAPGNYTIVFQKPGAGTVALPGAVA
ncbi:MAG TPA: carboxypeptidase regulatory-like domain-containing protein, partial [Bacteroidota bacterium]|nr:carboxypeptidase regulatory-like domain-containing protein [Bacteroidota bacterium]